MDRSDRNRITDRSRTNEAVSHALLALGILLLLFLSILIAWIIVCCERRRRKRKFRPGQQQHRDPLSIGSVIRSGPSPIINRHLLVHKPSQNLVIANKAFLSKSTPHLFEDDDDWRFQGVIGSTPSEPDRSTQRHQYRPVYNNYQKSVPRTWSEPQLPLEDPGGSQGSFQELSIHQQIAAILGTFPHLDFLSSKDSLKKSGSSLLKKKSDDEGPESLVDDLETTPLTNGIRPTTLLFQPPSPLPQKKEGFFFLSPKKEIIRDVEACISSPLMETTL